MSGPAAIQTTGLEKRFGDKQAVFPFDAVVQEGGVADAGMLVGVLSLP